MTSPSIRVVDPARTSVDVASVVSLMTQVFGERGDETALFRGWLDDATRCVRVALSATSEHESVVGLAVLTIPADFDSAAYGAPFEANVARLVSTGPVALFNQLVVAADARQTGVGGVLADAVASWLVKQRVGTVLGISWDHGGPHHSGHLFRRSGFDELGRCRGFYRRFHDATGQLCTVCGPRPCDCTAILFGRRL